MSRAKANVAVLVLLVVACGKVAHNDPQSNDGSGGATDDECVPIDVNGDGRSDGCDLDGDGIIDIVNDDDDDIVVGGGTDCPYGPPGVGDCVPGVPPTSQLPWLSNLQYDNTVRDLTGLDTQPSARLAPVSLGSMTATRWAGYRAAAVSIAEQVMADDDLKAALIPCDGADEACASEFIVSFGRRAYRRPLTSEEVTTYEGLYADRERLTENGSFDEAVQMMLEVFLISPSFLTRTETTEELEGSFYRLSSHEIANRLSYMLWDSMPDEELFEAADADELRTPEGIFEQAERMLQSPKARGPVARFHEQYAGMGPNTRWSEITRDPDLYPSFDEALVPLLSEETGRLFDHLVFEENATFQDLLTSPLGFVNADLAPLYGLDPADFGSQLELVEYDPDVRPGVFTRAGFLAAHAHPERTSPILRGAFLQKEVLCVAIPPPPPGAPTTPLPEGDNLTNRERVTAQTQGPACVACHEAIINPTGFALEGFDAIGAVQTTDNGVPVDTNASVLIDGCNVEVSGAGELMNAIALSQSAMRCYAEKWVAHAYQRLPNAMDQCDTQALVSKMQAGGYTVLNLVSDLTQSESMRYRTRGE